MKLLNLISEQAIVSELAAEGRDAAMMELLDALQMAGKVKAEHREDIALAILKREAVAPTALGHGVAIPHARTRYVTDFCGALGIARDGIDFSAAGAEPVNVIFLFLSPEHAISGHLALMAHIAGIARHKRYVELLRNARNKKEIGELIANCEAILFGPDGE